MARFFAAFLAALLLLPASASAQVRPLQDYFITCELDDVSTASTAYCAAPSAGKIVKIQTVIHGAITTADATVTAEIGGTAITGCSITVTQSGSAAGDVDSCTPSAANDLAEDDAIGIVTDGGSSTATRLTATIVVRR